MTALTLDHFLCLPEDWIPGITGNGVVTAVGHITDMHLLLTGDICIEGMDRDGDGRKLLVTTMFSC